VNYTMVVVLAKLCPRLRPGKGKIDALPPFRLRSRIARPNGRAGSAVPPNSGVNSLSDFDS
jgi:hypothetical protein